jgi:hypothetical protein
MSTALNEGEKNNLGKITFTQLKQNNSEYTLWYKKNCMQNFDYYDDYES